MARPKDEDRLPEEEARVLWALVRGGIAVSGKTGPEIAKLAGLTASTVRKIAGRTYIPSREAADKLIDGLKATGVEVKIPERTLRLLRDPIYIPTKFDRAPPKPKKSVKKAKAAAKPSARKTAKTKR
jgi:hypothetical protein